MRDYEEFHSHTPENMVKYKILIFSRRVPVDNKCVFLVWVLQLEKQAAQKAPFLVL